MVQPKHRPTGAARRRDAVRDVPAPAAGLDAEAVRALPADSVDGSEILRHDLARVFEGDYLPLFGLDRRVEELEAVSDLFRANGVPSDLSDVVTRSHQRAAARFGPEDGELMAIALLEERAGSLVRPAPDDYL